ncbi:hypothetical protein L9F63_004512, partial [Diploptera punctata]
FHGRRFSLNCGGHLQNASYRPRPHSPESFNYSIYSPIQTRKRSLGRPRNKPH